MKNLWGNNEPKAPTSSGTIGGWPSKANPGTAKSSDAAAPVAVKQKSGGTDRDQYWADKEARDVEKDRVYREEDLPAIRRSTSYNVAATLAAAALADGTISFGSAAKNKRLGMYLEAVDLIAAHVYAKINGLEVETGAVDADAEEEADEQLG